MNDLLAVRKPALRMVGLWLSLLLLFSSRPASAAWLRDCPVAQSELQCRLDSVLHGLYMVAAVLAVLLILVLGVAFLLYRKRKSDGSLID